MACIYQRKDIWQIKYFVEGRPRYRSLHTKKRKVAEKKRRLIEADLERGTYLEPSKTPLKDFLKQYRTHLEASKKNSPDSLYTELLKLKCFMEFLERKYPYVRTLETITSPIIADFLLFKLQKDKITPATANRYRMTLHVMFSYAIKHTAYTSRDLRFPNPAGKVDRFKEVRPPISYLDKKQIREQLKALTGHRKMQAMAATLIFSGLRRGEVIWLTKEDVDLDKRLIYVRAKKIGREEWHPKTRRSNRAIPISSALYHYLKKYNSRADCVLYFPSPEGKLWDADNFSTRLRILNKAKGLSWSCLDFRHTFGTQLAQKGESLYKISRLMGNSPQIAELHYAHLIPEEMRECVEFGYSPETGPECAAAETGAENIIRLADYRGREEPDNDQKKRGDAG